MEVQLHLDKCRDQENWLQDRQRLMKVSDDVTSVLGAAALLKMHAENQAELAGDACHVFRVGDHCLRSLSSPHRWPAPWPLICARMLSRVVAVLTRASSSSPTSLLSSPTACGPNFLALPLIPTHLTPADHTVWRPYPAPQPRMPSPDLCAARGLWLWSAWPVGAHGIWGAGDGV